MNEFVCVGEGSPRVLFVTRTKLSGLPERMTTMFARYGGCSAALLSPGPWDTPGIYRGQRFNKTFNQQGWNHWVEDRDQLDAGLAWADVVHVFYNTSLRDLGRADVLGTKPVAWHLTLRWNLEWYSKLLPAEDLPKYKLFLACEGWTRDSLDGLPWTIVPVLFPLEDPLFTPLPFAKRKPYVSMSPRVRTDFGNDGNRLAAPRSANRVLRKLAGLPFKLISRTPYRACMAIKAGGWLGIDDLNQPLVHGSFGEYAALGVPVLNQKDSVIEREFKEVTGADWIEPLIPCSWASVRRNVARLLKVRPEEWREVCAGVRAWMEKYYHPRDMVPRYLEAYRKA